jgi:hypothetical protein
LLHETHDFNIKAFEVFVRTNLCIEEITFVRYTKWFLTCFGPPLWRFKNHPTNGPQTKRQSQIFEKGMWILLTMCLVPFSIELFVFFWHVLYICFYKLTQPPYGWNEFSGQHLKPSHMMVPLAQFASTHMGLKGWVLGTCAHMYHP